MHNRGILVHRLLRPRGKDFTALSVYCEAGSCDQYKLGIVHVSLASRMQLRKMSCFSWLCCSLDKFLSRR